MKTKMGQILKRVLHPGSHYIVLFHLLTLIPSSARNPSRTRVMMFLSVAYAANCGGTGSMTGTGANLVLRNAISDVSKDSPLNFASWMFYASPGMLINLVLSWCWLQFWFLGWPGGSSGKNDNASSNVRRVLEDHYAGLGRMTFHEKSVLALMSVLIGLWCTRSPGFVAGWGDLFGLAEERYVPSDFDCRDNCSITIHQHTEEDCTETCSYGKQWKWSEAADDATAGMAIVLLLFALPRTLNFWPFEKSKELN